MIAVAGGKGGCGKTTTALGIARVLGRREPVTVVDADVDMPDLHVVTETPAVPGIDALADGASIDQCRHASLEDPGVSIVPAGTTSESTLTALERLGNMSEPVVVDTPAGASVDVIRPIRAAEMVVLVSTPTRESLVDTAKTAAIARSLGTPIAGLVINRSDGTIDPSSLLDCTILAHVPTVTDSMPYRAQQNTFMTVVRGIHERNT